MYLLKVSKGKIEECFKISKYNITTCQNLYVFRAISIFNKLLIGIRLII